MNINLRWSRKGIDNMAEKIREAGGCAELPALICLDMIVMLQAEVVRLESMVRPCTGIELIAAERQRQIEKEGWSPSHDDEHDDDSLAFAAACYALPREFQAMKVKTEMEDRSPRGGPCLPYKYRVPKLWPESWNAVWWNPKTRIHDLARAGALIAAEIDRLQRAEPDH